MRKIFIGFIILFSMAGISVASPALKCVSVAAKAQNKNILLPGVDDAHTTQIYFIKNISSQSLWLDHPVEHAKTGSGAGSTSSYLRPGQWSAILLNRKNYALSCAEIQPGKVAYQDCLKAISVCAPQQFTYESKRKGSYWLAEDQSWDDLAKNIGKRSGVKKSK